MEIKIKARPPLQQRSRDQPKTEEMIRLKEKIRKAISDDFWMEHDFRAD